MIYSNRRIVCLVLMSLTLLPCMPSCGRRQHHSFGRRDGNITETHNNGRDAEHNSRRGGCSRSRNRGQNATFVFESNTFYQPIYFTQNIDVHQNISFQETLYMLDPVAREMEQKYDVGGTKLIAEMSADAEGIYCSRVPYQEVNINILSLDELKLHVDYSKSSLYQQIINQQIVINSSNVGFLNGPSLAEILENFLNTLLTGKLVVHLSVANITNKAVRCEIKQGQMLEAVNENVQNLVVAETCKFSIAANQQTNLDIRVYCAARHRGDPSNSRVRFTPYFLNASSEIYESQSSVWNYIENGY